VSKKQDIDLQEDYLANRNKMDFTESVSFHRAVCESEKKDLISSGGL
jgi:hypothetical protein